MPEKIVIIPEIILSLFFIIGLLNAINPRMMWKTFDSWKAAKEPTNAYFMSRRIAGIVAMVIVLCIFLLPHIMSNL
ncbi:MAG: hypothetical protein Q8936_10865 [Bacillota bacterium]|nr:hypothetical protein [Bacillota bacterium]